MKEAPFHIEDHRLLFRETFNSEYSVRRNGGIPTDVTFSNGVGDFNTGNARIIYPTKPVLSTSGFSVRVKFTPSVIAGGYIASDFDGTNIGYLILLTSGEVRFYCGGATATNAASYDNLVVGQSYEIVGVYDGVNTKMYVDGVFSENAITPSAPSQFSGNHYIGVKHDISTDYEGDIDLVELYNYALTAEEVSNLYEGKRFTELTGQTEIINVSAQSGSIIDRWGNTLTNTATTVVKDGDVRCMKFDGATSKVDCGDPDALIGDKTISAWCLAKSYGETSLGKIIDNGELLVYIGSGYRLNVRSSTGVTAVSNINFFEFNKWFFVTVIRESDGTVSHYVNGIDETSTSNSDTPVAGSTNLIIGANNAGNTTWDGYINDVRIIDGLLTAEQISQLFSNERSQYRI
jgi:hypothetical protein